MQSVCRRWIGSAAVRAAALGACLLVADGARGQSAPWGWDTGGPAKAVWTPQNLAEFLLTGQTPHPAVARIIAPESSGTSMGSGVLVDVNRSQGLVITNWHVVRDSRSAVLVQFPDGFQSAGTVVRWDEAWDLAVLVIWKPRATPVTIAAAPPAIGDTLTIAGFGRGSYREESGQCLDYLSPTTGYPREFVELKATARQGDSGGPIFNASGELAGVLFGQSDGRTIGSCSTRVKTFLAACGSRGFVSTPIAEFSDARAIDRGIGLAATAAGPAVERIADSGGPVPRSAQVEFTADLPPAWSPVEVALRPEEAAPPPGGGQPMAAGFLPPAWATWPVDGHGSPDFLAAAGGLALIVLGLRVLFGGRGRERLD
jgi:S1-C subfamily serine protease